MWQTVLRFSPWSWIERRKTLQAYQSAQQQESAILARDQFNPLNLAKLATSVGDLDEAARRWAQARDRYPALVRSSRLSLDILLDLGRFDEAEQLMCECQRKFPRDPHYPAGLARVAHRRGDLPEAIRRWSDFRKKYPRSPEGFLHCAICQREAGLWDDAEASINRALALQTTSIFFRIEWARIAEARRNWDEALRRWTWIEQTMHHVAGTLGVAQALRELGRLDDAIAHLQAADYVIQRDEGFKHVLASLQEAASRH